MRSKFISGGTLALAATIMISSGLAQTWESRADAPLGNSGLPYSAGSALCAGDSFLFVLKGRSTLESNEFYQYNPGLNNWGILETLRMVGRNGTPVPAGAGASLTFARGSFPAGKVHCVKGNNSLEFWSYSPTGRPKSYPWIQKADIPTGGTVVTVGSSVAAATVGGLPYVYLLKGSGTTEFYRYDITNDQWQTLAAAPAGPSGRPYGPGSVIAFDGADWIYALKGNATTEFFAYEVDSNIWFTRAGLPSGPSGKPAGEGAGLIGRHGSAYALKGDSTTEFWKYDADSNRWSVCADLPAGASGRPAGEGTGLTYTPNGDQIYCLKADGTTEFYIYLLHPGLSEQAHVPTAHIALAAVPNPSRTMFRLGLPGTRTALNIRILDAAGRLVRDLGATRDVLWDGTDGRGQSLPPGIYFASATAGHETWRATLIKLAE